MFAVPASPVSQQQAMATASSSRKRTHEQFLCDDKSDLIIKLADREAASLTTYKSLLFPVSTCVRGLPAGAAEWDLSQLLIEGQPVSRDVVVAWLDAVHMCMYQEPFRAEQQQEPPLAATADGLGMLLAFADAVGSSKGVLAACLSQLDQLQFCVQAGEQQVQLSVETGHLWGPPATVGGSPQLLKITPNQAWEKVATVAFSEELTQQFATQLEVLLYLAHKLQLPQLNQAMHTCFRNNSSCAGSVLRHFGACSLVASERVLEAAGAQERSPLAFLNSLIVSQPTSVVGRSNSTFAVSAHESGRPPISFQAVLLRDFMGSGTRGQTVQVDLDLFNTSTARIGSVVHQVQLVFGSPLTEKDL